MESLAIKKINSLPGGFSSITIGVSDRGFAQENLGRGEETRRAKGGGLGRGEGFLGGGGGLCRKEPCRKEGFRSSNPSPEKWI